MMSPERENYLNSMLNSPMKSKNKFFSPNVLSMINDKHDLGNLGNLDYSNVEDSVYINEILQFNADENSPGNYPQGLGYNQVNSSNKSGYSALDKGVRNSELVRSQFSGKSNIGSPFRSSLPSNLTVRCQLNF